MSRRHWSKRTEVKVLPAVLRRDGYRCQIGLPGCTEVAECVDHIHPKSQGGSEDPSNLRAACHHCNRRKGRGVERSFFYSRGDGRAALPVLPPQNKTYAVVLRNYTRKDADDR